MKVFFGFIGFMFFYFVWQVATYLIGVEFTGLF